jgi:MFS family permease
MWWLSGIGLFASIYHPVGIPWLVRNAETRKGKALGFNGIFGSMGAAVAGLTAGSLIDLVNWRAAFIVPGMLILGTGLALLFYVRSGVVQDSSPEAPSNGDERGTVIRVFSILVITMFIGGLVFSATQTSLPKVFAERCTGIMGGTTFSIGILVAIVYGIAGLMQIAGGHLADRFPLKHVYVAGLLTQVPLLWLAATAHGIPMVVVATLAAVASIGALPAENLILVRYAPSNRHGLAFGLKFVLAFGATPVAVQLVALISERTGSFYWLFTILAMVVFTAFSLAMFLPRDLERKVV